MVAVGDYWPQMNAVSADESRSTNRIEVFSVDDFAGEGLSDFGEDFGFGLAHGQFVVED
jgi:hypothetical protein